MNLNPCRLCGDPVKDPVYNLTNGDPCDDPACRECYENAVRQAVRNYTPSRLQRVPGASSIRYDGQGGPIRY